MPEIPTVASLVVIVGILAVTTATSLVASKRADERAADGAGARDGIARGHDGGVQRAALTCRGAGWAA